MKGLTSTKLLRIFVVGTDLQGVRPSQARGDRLRACRYPAAITISPRT
jgi:hypothetical protein